MRAFLLTLFLLPALAFTQQAPEDLFASARPQVQITVAHTNMGSDLLEIVALEKDYPPELLRLQLSKLGELLGSSMRGLRVFPYEIGSGQGKLTFLKAECGVNGIVLPEQDAVNLQPIVQAFVGAKKPTADGEPTYFVEVLGITIVNQKPTPKTLKSFTSPAVIVQGQVNEQPAFIEYRVKILQQEPSAIQIPLNAEQKVQQQASTQRKTSVDWTLWGLIFVAGVAVGALVYSLLLRKTPKPRT